MLVFDGEVRVSYSQFTLETPNEMRDGIGAPFAGQANGLCGAQVPGMLEFVTGLHTGYVPVVVEVLDIEPALDASWEEVVEVSLATSSRTMMLLGWAGESADELDLGTTGSWRARYHLQNMEPARQHDTRRRGETPIDRYLLQLWLAPPAPDLVLRQTSEHAAYWHRAHPEQTPPPPQATPVLPPQLAVPEPQPAPSPGIVEDD